MTTPVWPDDVSGEVTPPSLEELVATLGLREPTEEQARVAQYPPVVVRDKESYGAPLLVVAGAGSGKTETLSLRATYLAAHYGIAGENILGLTFTRKAAAELGDRLRSRLQSWARRAPGAGAQYLAGTSPLLTHAPEATTYNAFALAVTQEFGASAGIDPAIAHLGEAAAWQLMSETVAGWSGDLTGDFKESSIVDRALRLRQEIANQAMDTSEARRGLERLQEQFEEHRGKKGWTKSFHEKGSDALQLRLELLNIIDAFEEEKTSLGRMDYADQVLAAIRIVEEVPEAKAILRQRHRIVFLDEFQDTSVAQMRFLASLFHDHPVTAVGDPNQAIYGWRGASAASLVDFHPMFTRVKETPKETLTLSTAWRNDRTVLRAANEVSAPLSLPPSYLHIPGVKSEQTVVLPDLQPRPGAGSGAVEVQFSPSTADAQKDMVAFVREARERFSSDKGPASVAILARKNAPLRAAVAALREAGIPAQIVGGDSLLGHPAVMDLRAALEITADIGSSPNLLRLLTNLDLGAADLVALGRYARHLPTKGRGESDGITILLEAVDACREEETEDAYPREEGIPHLSPIARLRVANLARSLHNLRAHAGDPISDQVMNARVVLGLEREAASDPTSENVSDVLDVFTSVAIDYEMTTTRPTMEGFLTWLEAADKQERGIALPSVRVDPDAVQVMTIHASKGLEWDAVAVIDMEMGSFPKGGKGSSTRGGITYPPSIPASQLGWWANSGLLPYPLRRDSSHLPSPHAWEEGKSGKVLETRFKEEVGAYLQDEERRLAYVAMTRARYSLFLSGSWMGEGGTPRYPSVFIDELVAASETLLLGHPTKQGLMREGETSVLGADTQTEHASPLSRWHLAPLPEPEERESLRAGGTDTHFPREPGPVRRKSEQAAARVREEFEALTSEESTSSRAQIISGLSDPGLAADISALLAQRDRGEAASDFTSDDTSPQRILEQVAQSRPLSVTEIAGFYGDPEATAQDLIRPLPARPGTSTLLGTAFHKWMEGHLRRLSSGAADLDDADNDDIALSLGREDQQVLAEMQKSVHDLNLPSLYTVVGVEVPFSLTERGRIVRGRIDAVLRDRNSNFVLVDWKTSGQQRPRLTRTELVRYATQLRYYREAWTSRAEEEGVKLNCSLVFVSPEGVSVVTEEEVQRRLRALERREEEKAKRPLTNSVAHPDERE